MEEASGAVKQLLPDVNLSSGDLSQSPKLTKLLLLLTERLDPSGLSLTVKRDLAKTKRELQKQKQEWMRVGALQRVLDETLADYHARRWGAGVRSEDQQFFQTLEQCLVLGRCCRRLDTRETDGEDSRPSLLGLQREHLQEMLPGARELQAMRQRLVPEVEKRLKERCFSVLCYYHPEYEDNSEVLKMAKSGAMADMLEADKQRLETERERGRENQITITNQTITYLTLLYRTFELLRELIEKHRLRSQLELDTELEQYLNIKSKAMFAKLGLMKLELRHQLFNKETVEAHNCIRALLLEQLEKWQQSADSLRGTLIQYQMLGVEFEQLASEYGRLRELLGNKKWALEEFSKSQR